MKLIGRRRTLIGPSLSLDETHRRVPTPRKCSTMTAGSRHAGRRAPELDRGAEVFVPEPGDSAYFDSTKPHRFRNPTTSWRD